MKIVYVKENVVQEIIPEYALPVEEWYSSEFAAKCVEAPDDVEQRWVYDPETGIFSAPQEPEPEPEPDPAPTTEDRVAALEAENKTLKAQVSALTDQNDFQEELIVELAGVVYA